jgi:DNA-binding NtrC family response regulator
VVEDDAATRQAWRELIGSWGFEVTTAEDGVAALDVVASFRPDLLLLDLRLPRKDGLTVLKELRDRNLAVVTIVVSGEGEIPDAVRAIKLGASDYLCKPVDIAHLKQLLESLFRDDGLDRLASQGSNTADQAEELVGSSAAMGQVRALIHQVAPTSASVIVLGESGTGKELVARSIHQRSRRSGQPYVAINCAAVPDTLIESELFGHERGAFTGAEQRRPGCFELASGGTLLLDEIGEMKVEVQAKLLRVLEENKFRRLGGTSEIAANVRVIAASNRDLDAARHNGSFREDLYYRLNVFTIKLPPLRERADDLAPLVEYFLRDLAIPSAKVRGIHPGCIEVLRNYRWPGNVRQLRNVMERALIVTSGPMITVADLPPEITRPARSGPAFEVSLGSSLDDVERELIERTLEFARGNKARAAEILGVSLKTLYNRLERYQPKGQAPSA